MLPTQRGNVSVENVRFINGLLYICENGCKWRGLPKEYGNWNAVYKRFNRWVKLGIIANLFRACCHYSNGTLFGRFSATLRRDFPCVPPAHRTKLSLIGEKSHHFRSGNTPYT